MLLAILSIRFCQASTVVAGGQNYVRWTFPWLSVQSCRDNWDLGVVKVHSVLLSSTPTTPNIITYIAFYGSICLSQKSNELFIYPPRTSIRSKQQNYYRNASPHSFWGAQKKQKKSRNEFESQPTDCLLQFYIVDDVLLEIIHSTVSAVPIFAVTRKYITSQNHAPLF
jgi:hypothetical protein